MITIEEYIKKRKEDEKINEFDLENKSENMQIFIGYVIEYYNTYIDVDKMFRCPRMAIEILFINWSSFT